MIIASSHDFEKAARRRVPRFLFDYAEGGAYDEVTLARNVSDLAAIALRQRVLKDVANVDLKTTLFGREVALPVALGPVGISGMYARRGEVQAARAAKAAGIPTCLSTVSICALEEVAAAADPFWFQLYVIRDRGFMRDLIARAKAAGAEAMVFTVDMPIPGARYRSEHSGMAGPNARLRQILQAIGKPHWAWDVGLMGRPHTLGNLAPVLGKDSGLSDYMGWLGKNFDPSIQWKDLDWIRAEWDRPLIIKGILDPEDAREAAAIGANGIVVSNHGGRQLDGVLSSARALPPIADAVGGQLTVLADGGIRTGLDVVRMLALGADGVLLGRAWVYALAAQGEAGVTKLLALIAREMKVAMTLTGVNRIGAIDRSILAEGVK
ncbi:alpha-hydroxy-acid oxidizing protein [Sphingomonas koreensis]|jgi:L-lactate dehydrogenase (cytochrome)|uniref:Alpha-hydroxy-acid oxidizing enzyme n=1 Tax=Sphingomonas koreensis TaxID=93064 RepID=A0A1L6J5X3_9SPHN|nr:FMN-dependent L-lactate dehydrogenase LldD [Sphingomonas koreensis]APR51288.1 alpha-hydroxy-acid oxidizing enzyme [Sphingomonas koreensis]MDC7810380.1 FMN-dependent L-lactate dehydrogenase LldD [Sphingomonas koreensis]RSU17576.1 alpha-hydroxy-acid oxidizing protein [Sphingomonas koreensis]RSU21832.1 alpha-hydroxy-acid oxidizing protein [Sphingomonas koreensis]RSU26199.1 alpha-hydroxy-acid oxidizing protein [Sphingomonas koreensis]